MGELVAVHPVGEVRDGRRILAGDRGRRSALAQLAGTAGASGPGCLGGDRLEVAEQLGAGRVGGELVEHRADRLAGLELAGGGRPEAGPPLAQFRAAVVSS